MQALNEARKQGMGKDRNAINLLAEKNLQETREEDLRLRKRRAEKVRLLAPGT